MVCNRTALPLFSEFFSKLLKAIMMIHGSILPWPGPRLFRCPHPHPAHPQGRGWWRLKDFLVFFAEETEIFSPHFFTQLKATVCI